MKNEELMKYIKAEDEGKKIEQCRMGRDEWIKKNPDEDWVEMNGLKRILMNRRLESGYKN